MITEQQMTELAAKVNNTYLHMDNAFGGQCWDSAAWIMNYFGLPVINTGNTATKKGRWPGWAGNMVDCFPQSDAIAAAYELVAPDQSAQPGDTLVWGDSYKEWYPATHVATAIKDKLNGWVLCLSQNSSAPRPDLPGYSPDASGPTIIQLLPKRGLIGIIRPRFGMGYASTTPTDEDEFMPSEEYWKNLIGAVDKINNRVDMLPDTPEYWKNLNGAVDNIHNRTANIGDTVWKHSIDNRDAVTGELQPRVTTPETVLSYADRRLVLILDSITASARGLVDAVKAAPGPDAEQIAEDAFSAFLEKLQQIKLGVTAGGE